MTTADSPVVTVSEQRWRTTLWLSVAGTTTDSNALHAHLATTLRAEADRLERAASRFRDDSELSALNRSPGEWRDVSPVLADVLTAALDAAAATNGLTNPCLGADVDRAGYRGWRDATLQGEGGSTGASGQHRSGASAVDAWQTLEVVRGRQSARARIGHGYQVDLGAVAKGWLADRLAADVTQALGGSALANMGGDLRATGDLEWTVAIDALVPGLGVTTFTIVDAGLATSSRARRTWTGPDGPAHHVIDPRTQQPAQTPWWSVSVLAASATDANAAATAAFVLGTDAPTWLSDAGLDALLVAHEPGSSTATHYVGRWPSRGQVA